MQQQHPSTRQRSTSIRSILGGSALVAGLLMSVVGLGAGQVGAAISTQTVALHNQDAGTGSDCPDGPEAAWHFVTAPNDNSFVFQEITLNLGGTPFTFSGGSIIPNGTQVDNVFVKVPSGYTVDDLLASGSSAKISPATGTVKFVLSHVCQADIPTTTTTTTVEETTTTTVDDTTTTTVDDTTTTTVDDTTTTTVDDTTTTTVDDTTTTTVDDTTTTTVDESTTTTTPDDSTTTTVVDDSTTTTNPDDSTTTTVVDSGGPTTTAPEVDTTDVKSGGPTTTIVASEGPTTTVASFSLPTPRVGSLPETGADNAMILVVGGILTLLGAVILMTGRRPRTI